MVENRVAQSCNCMRLCLLMEVDMINLLKCLWVPNVDVLLIPRNESSITKSWLKFEFSPCKQQMRRSQNYLPCVGIPKYSMYVLGIVPLVSWPKFESEGQSIIHNHFFLNLLFWQFNFAAPNLFFFLFYLIQVLSSPVKLLPSFSQLVSFYIFFHL